LPRWILWSVAIPGWVKQAIDDWTTAAGITEGLIFRAITEGNRNGGHGKVWGGSLPRSRAATDSRLNVTAEVGCVLLFSLCSYSADLSTLISSLASNRAWPRRTKRLRGKGCYARLPWAHDFAMHTLGTQTPLEIGLQAGLGRIPNAGRGGRGGRRAR
jgi:hypothetical protein